MKQQTIWSKVSNFKHHHKVAFAILIGTAVVSFWRGAWGLLDLYIIPANEEASYWLSLLLGIGVLYLTHYVVKELI
jgi:hypothetical protein